MSRVQKFFIKPSLTKQAFRDECDVNHIVKRFRDVNGFDLVSNLGLNLGGHYLDVSFAPDLRERYDIVEKAKSSFAALPAQLRKRFGHDPLKFFDFCSDPANLAEMKTLGLAKQAAVSEEAAATA